MEVTIRTICCIIKISREVATSLVKEDGSADATYQYTDFGETIINGDNKAENEVCYTGGIYDQSTGLYYLNARYSIIQKMDDL